VLKEKNITTIEKFEKEEYHEQKRRREKGS
jgi:hypothetical protein